MGVLNEYVVKQDCELDFKPVKFYDAKKLIHNNWCNVTKTSVKKFWIKSTLLGKTMNEFDEFGKNL